MAGSKRRSKCPVTGKIRYRDQLSASIALWKARSKPRRDPVECRFYYHQSCHGWHLTSQPPRENDDR